MMDSVPVISDIVDALIYELRKKFPQFTYSRRSVFMLDADAEEHNTNDISISIMHGARQICEICVRENGILEFMAYGKDVKSASTPIKHGELLITAACTAVSIDSSCKVELFDPSSMDIIFDRIERISLSV